MLRMTTIALSMALGIAAAHAQSDATAGVHATITNQIEATSNGDWDRAYSFAAPNIKRIFPTRQAFQTMVETGYPQVAKPRRFDFGKSEQRDNGSIAQSVIIQGSDGRDYEAIYTLQLQEDGIYRITGVSLRAATTIGA